MSKCLCYFVEMVLFVVVKIYLMNITNSELKIVSNVKVSLLFKI